MPSAAQSHDRTTLGGRLTRPLAHLAYRVFAVQMSFAFEHQINLRHPFVVMRASSGADLDQMD